jgi:DNA invertase Pin-like site-specific DNA recombinase
MLGLVLIFGALAEFERNLIRERTQAGLTAARARGRKGGRPKALTGKQLSIAQDLYEKRHPITEICRTLKISKATLYRYITDGAVGWGAHPSEPGSQGVSE